MIVIDGGSYDGIQQEIKLYKERIDYYISEKDEGILSYKNQTIPKKCINFLEFLVFKRGINDSLNILK